VKRLLVVTSAACICLVGVPLAVGQMSPGLGDRGQYNGGLSVGSENLFVYSAVEVDVEAPNSVPLNGTVYVSLIRANGQVLMTSKVENGKARFANVPKSELTAEVMASGYETAKKSFEVGDKGEVKVLIDLQPMADKEAAASDRGISALNPKAQKHIGRALEALRTNKPTEARENLEAAQRDAPNSAEVAYLFGVYAQQMNDSQLARSYFLRALELNPNHLSALLAVSQDLLRERKTAQAAPYVERALEVEPSSWRAHLLMAQVDLFQGKKEDAVKEAERAIDLGHDRADSVQPLLAHALFEEGQKDRAMQLLERYVQEHPKDTNAAKLLEQFKSPVKKTTVLVNAKTGAAEDTADVGAVSMATAVPLNWMPPDVDENVPPVEPGPTCSLDDLVQKAGAELVAFVHDVDRFTATESLTHESINRYGMASAPEKRKFDYLVSIQDLRPGYLGVTEYRNGGGAQTEFPDGVVTNGLPALVLIFHPYYAPNYEMACEGLARSNGQLAWQIHFRQWPNKPSAIKSYQFGLRGPSYPVALKGRAWISADTYQVIRMETDIVAPIPQIKLVAEHTAIEYGPVKFQKANVSLWLPQSAEVYFVWGGKQIHRRHTFGDYLLFGVDEKEKIAAPKELTSAPDLGSTDSAKP
jgi:tetratricopeptide (TPR) repeat protein